MVYRMNQCACGLGKIYFYLFYVALYLKSFIIISAFPERNLTFW